MINKLVEWSLNNRFLVLGFFLTAFIASLLSLSKLPVDAIPNIGDNQVIVYVDWPGRSPKDVEDQVTYPLTTSLLGIPGVKAVRGNSMFGFSTVNIIFNDNIELYWARTRILEKLNLAQKDLPSDAVPVLGPDASPLDQIFWYTIEGEGQSLAELRTIQDYYVKYQLNAVPGVSEVASVGGYVKQYQIQIDPNKLYSHNIPLSKVIMEVKKANQDVGAQVLEENSQEFIIRSKGFLKNIKDIEDIVIGSKNGVPVFIKNVGVVTLGPDFRRNALDKMGKEVVGGVVIQRYGENPREVINRVKKKIKEISPGFPKGVRIVPFYDRTRLVDNSIMNLVITIILQILITILVVVLFLKEAKSSLAVSIVLPVAVVITMPLLLLFKVSPNIMSLGGIAIAIGVVVDAGIVVVENIFSHVQHYRNTHQSDILPLSVYVDAVKEVASPIFYTMIIIVVAFLNVYLLDGQAGKMFKPLAYAKNIVMGLSAIISVTLIPVVAVFLVKPKKLKKNQLQKIQVETGLQKSYGRSLEWVLKHKVPFLITVSVILGVFLFSMTFLEREFMPPLDEGDILFMPVLQPGANISEVKHIMAKQDQILASFPEVESAVGKSGRAETSTDPAPIAMIETIIQLKPKNQWRKGMTKQKLLQEMNEHLSIPGVANIWTQPVRNRIDMLSTGIQTPIGIKVFGQDLKELEKLAVEIEAVIKTVPGNRSPYAERIGNKPYVEITLNRAEAARYGINVDDVNMIIMSAIGGMNITRIVEGTERNPLNIIYLKEFRGSVEAIGRTQIPTSYGTQIPLKEIADIKKTLGPAKISTENGVPYIRVFVNLDTEKRGILDFVEDAKKAVATQVKFPPGYFPVWSGQYQYEISTQKKLLVILPITVLVIFLLLQMKFKSPWYVATMLLALPFGLIGGVALQFIMGVKMSTAVKIGYIALMGVAVEDGVVFMEFLTQNLKTGGNLLSSVIESGKNRVRAIIMTTMTTIIALLPVLFSRGSGSELMLPIAVPTFGGMITATLANLYVLPVIFTIIEEKRQKKENKLLS